MEEYKSPVYNVISVPIDKVVANTYNPNVVAPPGNETIGTIHLGRRLHDALRLLLHPGKGYL